ncbi:MAG: DNA topoisomerase IV subunit A [Bacillota bacterium]|nr:DNA topoisomerase IV subunit A [Bacillota bacterium]
MAKKEKEIVENILENTLEDIIADRFARYSKYIIQERALPDARDGMKPVQRRILWAMHEDGNTYNRPYHKSAKTVGNVIGNYHPHGDTSVYDAMVRLSQNWKIRTPLVDMQGNNGSIDDDPAAAMRYTEARLSKIANFLLQDIEKKTVEWAPNFSDEKMEPTVLPARYPNLLVNGITGIAAGYATNIPPHNLNEVVDATIYRIQNPDCSLEDLMRFVKGPDFPTGGTVMGLSGIKDAFRTGRGRVFIRSKVHVETQRTLKQIIITEIPYEVVKSSLVKKIDDIHLNKKVDGILDVRDESDRTGLRIVVDLKLDAPHEHIINYLYKNTDLQVSYNYNVIAIVNKAPVQMSLPMALDAFIAHREDVVLRRSKFEYDQKQNRAHILEGLIRAVSVMDEVVQIIRKSKDKADAKKNLIKRFVFTEMQAEAIVTMRLYRLTNTDVKELQAEFKQLEKDIKHLTQIINNKKVLHNVLVQELEEVNREFETPRLSSIEEEIEEIVIDKRAMIAQENIMLPVTRDGYVKKVSLRSYNASSDSLSGHKDSDEIIAYGEVNTLQYLLFFTNRGTYGYIPVYQIEEGKWKDLGSHMSNYLRMEGGEKIVSVKMVNSFDEKVQLVLVSKFGMIKRVNLKDFEVSRMNKTMLAMNIGDMDELVSVSVSYKRSDQIALVSNQGYGLTYPIEQVALSSPRSKGVKAMNLVEDDFVKGLLIFDSMDQQVLLINQTCQLKRMKASDIPVLKRPAKGVRLYKWVKSNPSYVHDFLISKDDMEMRLMDELIRFKGKEISLMSTDSTFSAPFTKTEDFFMSSTIEQIHEGEWNEEVQDIEQPTLFD